jgi:uncharacterized protein
MQSNPYNSKLALANSSYWKFHENALVSPSRPAEAAPALVKFVHGQVRVMVLEPEFICIGARATLLRGSYRFGMYEQLNSRAATAGLGHDLFTFVQDLQTMDSDFTTFIASFKGPMPHDEKHFESLVWDQLQNLHEMDAAFHRWDPSVSDDPQDPRFSFSFAECAFFIIGMHAGSSRWSRRFAWPTLVFNAHHQFEKLREKGQYQNFQRTIRAKDVELQGNHNPNLGDFGKVSDARQYSGRLTEEDWKCPFHSLRKE